jgi:hypothetical protein
MVQKESSQNDGGNRTIYDRLFGFGYLPITHEVQELGLVNWGYSLDFLEQMTVSVLSGADNQTVER